MKTWGGLWNLWPKNSDADTLYKVQLIQSIHDDRSCRQELKINRQHVWQKKSVPCQSLKTGVQDIYTSGNVYDQSKAQIKKSFFFHILDQLHD